MSIKYCSTNHQQTTNDSVRPFIPYGHQWIDEEDIAAVVEVLRSDWLTTGPKVAEFEKVFAEFVGIKEAVAVSSGTAALHAAMYAADIGPGDEVILPPMTFVATANTIVLQGGIPVFADIDPDTLLVNSDDIEAKITPRTKAIIAVDYAGQPCSYDALRDIVEKYNLVLIADACHSLGAEYKGRSVGTLADLTAFSFHPVKHITTGEGGMVTTHNSKFADKIRRFRNHGIDTDHRKRAEQGTWYYEMTDLGFNYRITDFQCALGISQLNKLPRWITRRREVAEQYDRAFLDNPYIKPLSLLTDSNHVYHLYVVRFIPKDLMPDRLTIFSAFQNKGIGVNVHYIPVHLHPYYRKKFLFRNGDYPLAEEAYQQIISLPIFPGMNDEDVNYIISESQNIVNDRSRKSLVKILRKNESSYNQLTNNRLSQLVLGTAQLGMDYGIANKTGQPDLPTVKKIVQTAWESGIKEFDTADNYGDSEMVLGNALSVLGITNEVKIITKLDPNIDCFDRSAMLQLLESSLKRLKVRNIYGIMIHREELLDYWSRGLGEILLGFAQDGIVKEIGISVYSPDKAIQALETEGIGIVQVPTNLLDKRFLENGVFRLAKIKGKRIYIRSIFLQGLILIKPDKLSERMNFADNVLRKLHSLSQDLNMTIPEMTFGYLKLKFPNANIIFGAETSRQIKENVGWWKNKPDESSMRYLEEAIMPIDEKILNPALWPPG